MKILVTGGAGYIGSAFVKLAVQDNEVIVLDNLSKGKIELVDKKAKFYHADLTNKLALEKIFSENKIDAVVHFAAYKAVGESMKDAVKYSGNIAGTMNLLNAMVKFNVNKIVFSSSAAVYGLPKEDVANEETKLEPINFYGFTKLECERIIEWYNQVHKINFICLRYFNVAGDAGLKYQDPEAENVFPIIMETISGKRKEFTIFGEDYNTSDGTCVRDYIHINDLVQAHLLAIKSNYNGPINLGTGNGFSVKSLVEEFIKITGKKFPYKFGPRRAGDPACLVASNKKAKEILGWQPKFTIQEMIKSTFDAYK